MCPHFVVTHSLCSVLKHCACLTTRIRDTSRFLCNTERTEPMPQGPLTGVVEWFDVNGCYRFWFGLVCLLFSLFYSRSCCIAQTCLKLMIPCLRLLVFKAGIPNSILCGGWRGSLEINLVRTGLYHFTTEVHPQPLEW